MINTKERLGAITLLAFVACGGGAGGSSALGEAADPSDVDRTIEIHTEEFKFSLDEIEVEQDETIEFVVTNDGRTAHEFSLGTDHMDSGDHVHGAATGSTGAVPPGETVSLIWHFLEAGETLFACYIAGHDKQGMTGTLTVGE